MTVDIALQVRGMCQAVLLGGCLGLVYDALRLARRCLPFRWVEWTLDLGFWLWATLALFLFSHRAWGGEIRLYGALFCLMGGGVYFWGISPVILPPVMGILRFFRRLLGIFTRPARWLWELFKRFGKFAKTSFHSGEKGV